jgi:hypothetical protein
MSYFIAIHTARGPDGRQRQLLHIRADEADVALIDHLQRQRTAAGAASTAFAAFRAYVLTKYAAHLDRAAGLEVGYGLEQSGAQL